MAGDPHPRGLSVHQKEELAAALAAALFLIYQGHRAEALARLDNTLAADHIPAPARAKIAQFANLRAQKVLEGVNKNIARATADLPPEATDGDRTDALGASHADTQTYNDTTLLRYMATWAAMQGLIDAYQETPSDTGSGSAADAVQWEWVQVTDFMDDCTEAMDASPAPLDDLLSITGGPPPIHPNCQCSLSPVQ